MVWYCEVMRPFQLVSLVLVSCSGGGSSGPDAAPDSPPVKVVALSSCPTTVAATVVDSPTMFVPAMTTIRVGEVVKFTINAEHFVIPNVGAASDPALMVSRGETKCFRFNVTGTYGFVCGVHGFAGTITVQ